MCLHSFYAASPRPGGFRGSFSLVLQCSGFFPARASRLLNALAIDSQHVYTVATKKPRGTPGKLTPSWPFQEGKIAFFQSFEGRITGFVFSGIGHVVALPRDPVEKQQVARFLGAPVLDEQFLSLTCDSRTARIRIFCANWSARV